MAKRPEQVRMEKAKLFKRFFESADGLAVLAELKAFCFLEDTTVGVSVVMKQVDPYLTVRNEGRRQVLLEIMRHAGLTYQDIERERSIIERENLMHGDRERDVYEN